MKRILNEQEIQNIETKLRLYNHVININSRDSKAYYMKALELIKLDKNEEALECLDNAIRLDADIILYHVQKANLCADLGRYNDAKEELSKIKHEDLSNDAYDKNIKGMIINVQNKVLESDSKTNGEGNHDDNIPNKSSSMQMMAELKNRIVVLEEENKQFKGKLNYLEKENKQFKGGLSYLENSIKELVCIIQDDSSTEENYEQNFSINGKESLSTLDHT